MSRRDVALASAAGAIVAVVIGFAPSLLPGPIVQYVLAPALDFWLVGLALVVVAFLLRNRPGQLGLARSIGVVGVAWIAFAIGFYVLLVLILVFLSPIGY